MVRLGGFKKTYPKKNPNNNSAESKVIKPGEGETAESKVETNITQEAGENNNNIQPNTNANLNNETLDSANKKVLTLNLIFFF